MTKENDPKGKERRERLRKKIAKKGVSAGALFGVDLEAGAEPGAESGVDWDPGKDWRQGDGATGSAGSVPIKDFLLEIARLKKEQKAEGVCEIEIERIDADVVKRSEARKPKA